MRTGALPAPPLRPRRAAAVGASLGAVAGRCFLSAAVSPPAAVMRMRFFVACAQCAVSVSDCQCVPLSKVTAVTCVIPCPAAHVVPTISCASPVAPLRCSRCADARRSHAVCTPHARRGADAGRGCDGQGCDSTSITRREGIDPHGVSLRGARTRAPWSWSPTTRPASLPCCFECRCVLALTPLRAGKKH